MKPSLKVGDVVATSTHEIGIVKCVTYVELLGDFTCFVEMKNGEIWHDYCNMFHKKD